MLIFAGNDFDVTEDYRRLKSLLIGKCFNTYYLQDSSGRYYKTVVGGTLPLNSRYTAF